MNVGLIYSKTGPLSSYGAQYAEGFAIGLDYATHHTGMAGGHKIVVTERDDTGVADKAVAAAKELIGQGYKILGGLDVVGRCDPARAASRKKTTCCSSPAQRPRMR